MLRVIVDPSQFPSLAPEDRYFDTHVHTIAEQTTSGVLDVNGASKAFGGPIVMLLEASYALGLVQTQPRDGNWADYRDSIVVTDHNMFYSREPYDTGVPPRFGPTATTDGHAGEAAWYRANLGGLAGEEITLRRGSNQDDSAAPEPRAPPAGVRHAPLRRAVARRALPDLAARESRTRSRRCWRG